MRCFLRLLGEQGTRGPSGRLAWLALACPGVLGAPARTQAVAAFLLAGAAWRQPRVGQSGGPGDRPEGAASGAMHERRGGSVVGAVRSSWGRRRFCNFLPGFEGLVLNFCKQSDKLPSF